MVIATKQQTPDIWQTLESAQSSPELADIVELVNALDVALAELPQQKRLLHAAEAFVQIAEIYAERAKWLLSSGAQTLSPDVLLPLDFLNELVRQSSTLDLQDLLQPLPPRKNWETDLDMLDAGIDVESSPDPESFYQANDGENSNSKQDFIHKLSKPEHAENVSDWIAAIATWFTAQQVEFVNLRELCHQIDLDLVQVWMAVLIGGFPIQQNGEFYDAGAIRVCSLNTICESGAS